NTPFSPPTLPSAGVLTPFFRSPGISAVDEYRVNDTTDKFLNTTRSSGLQMGPASSKYFNVSRVRLDPRDYSSSGSARMVENVAADIGRFQPLLGFVKETRKRVTGSPMVTLHGVRRFNEMLRMYARERQNAVRIARGSGRPVDPVYSRAPGSADSIDWFRREV